MGKLEGKVVLIVGSTSGIGKATAELFAREGATVVVTGRRAEKGQAVADGITAQGGKALFYKLDCSVLEECYEVLDKVIETCGKLDIIHWNSGVGTTGSSQDALVGNVTPELWDYVFTTNIRNAFFTVQKAIPELKKNKGSVLLTASVAGFDAQVAHHTLAYGASKAAVIQMVKVLALNLAPDIRVNAIAPGVTKTEILSQVPKENLDRFAETIPMKKLCSAEEMAAMALFLSSDDAATITGQNMVIDGGASL